MIRYAPLAVFVLLAAILVFALLGGGKKDVQNASQLRDLPAAAIEGIDRAALEKGEVLVNFFASWCVSCVGEQAVLMDMAKRGVRIYGVAYNDDPEKTRAWLDRHGNPFTAVGHDPNGRAAIDWGVSGVPETFFLRDGKIVRHDVGALEDAQGYIAQMQRSEK